MTVGRDQRARQRYGWTKKQIEAMKLVVKVKTGEK
jgi:hypothetical protein